ncbi:hypothetical protein CASFOL_042038 [Castilleja foliolosa]|uniref:Uncharacterized protein n=1 Tax=Castilleja foliolosa TaxID=1961234 RepID=A0ABD3B9L9_9LAMI
MTDGRPKIDWTDFIATRELVLLLHDHGLNCAVHVQLIELNQLDREDLLASDVIRAPGPIVMSSEGSKLYYLLIVASLLGYRFIGSDITDVAIERANQNINSNPHVFDLIEIRTVGEECVGEGTFDSSSANVQDGYSVPIYFWGLGPKRRWLVSVVNMLLLLESSKIVLS